jgi:hypothetical protein
MASNTWNQLLYLQPDRDILNFVIEGLVFETGEPYRLDTTLSLTRSCTGGIPAGRANQGLDASTRSKQYLGHAW